MAVSYKKLWHILLARDMKKKDLAELAGFTSYTIKSSADIKQYPQRLLGRSAPLLTAGQMT